MFKAKINVTLKESVLDPQGKTILNALGTLGINGVKDVRVGKYFVLNLDTSNRAQAEEHVRKICDKLLVNPVIEKYELISLEGEGR
ncbi:MAG: phosphoribosylformylglycinamidine synthase subunit PurS [Candidatus Omnitrophica bacterium]|nr:phosphoribosylformylglycinamidine synthase subunit PurS [Candidatus Omnitrophota bacterium]